MGTVLMYKVLIRLLLYELYPYSMQVSASKFVFIWYLLLILCREIAS